MSDPTETRPNADTQAPPTEAQETATEPSSATEPAAEPAHEDVTQQVDVAAEETAQQVAVPAEDSAEVTEPEPGEAVEVAAASADGDAEASPEEDTPATPTTEAEEPPQIEADAAKADEPAKVEAEEGADGEPAQTDPAGGEPATADAAEGEPAKADAADGEPAKASDETSEKAAPEEPLSEEMQQLATAMGEKRLVEGQVIGWNKGGYHVALGKIAAFCPVSQIEIGNPRSPKQYLDKTFNFHIIEIQKGGRRVVVSRAAAVRSERKAIAAKAKDTLTPGLEREGKIRSLTDFGAFVDLGGGIEGLVHVSEISRRRVENPREVLEVGQEVKVSVLKVEKGGRRISLSMKRLEKDPWKDVAERFKPGDAFTGTIVRKTDFGLFVEVEPGLEGLIHTSRFSHGQTLEDEALAVGKNVEGWIHDADGKRRRLSLSLRPVASGNPWKEARERYPEGEVVQGTVERLASFGAFIELEPGLTGLLPFSALKSGNANPRRQYHPGKEVSVRVLTIDPSRRRISLGTEASQAEGSSRDYQEYLQASRTQETGGMTALAAAFAKLKDNDKTA